MTISDNIFKCECLFNVYDKLSHVNGFQHVYDLYFNVWVSCIYLIHEID